MLQLGAHDWAAAAGGLVSHGWARVGHFAGAELRAELGQAAPDRWQPQGDVGTVKQAGGLSGDFLSSAPAIVREVGAVIQQALARALPSGVLPPPDFNEVSWSKSLPGMGHHFITEHRDPPGVGRVIAIITLDGRARFRVWAEPFDELSEWETEPGDLVLLQGTAWPTANARCPRHEVESPTTTGRSIVTFRFNRGGAGADYFA